MYGAPFLIVFRKVELAPRNHLSGLVQHRPTYVETHYFGSLRGLLDAVASESRLFDGLTTDSLVDISSAGYPARIFH